MGMLDLLMSLALTVSLVTRHRLSYFPQMRADRLLAALLLLQARGRLSARVLAERLEVSPRTVSRDMEALSMAGVPVYAERGRNGGWALTEAYRTDLTGLTESELRSLILATAPPVLADLGLSGAADRALLKVLSALPDSRRRQAESARRYLHIDPTGWRGASESVRFLPLLEEALRLGRRVEMGYERAFEGGVVERRLDPLGLVAKGSTWYLVAGIDDTIRTYRASRIRALRVLDEPATRPPDFDLAAFWSRSREEFRALLPRFNGVIRVTPEALDRIRGGWRFAEVEDESGPGADGRLTLRMRWDSFDVAVEQVLGLGPQAEVVEPAELHERVIALAGELVEHERRSATVAR
jgi:predicted DNA-binding transcriptional regulator YafY